MSVLVADANGNPVANTTVSLSAWPIAFNANGTACSPLAANDHFHEDDVSATPTFFENLSLDAGEDGVRKRDPSGTVVAGGYLRHEVDTSQLGSRDFPGDRRDQLQRCRTPSI